MLEGDTGENIVAALTDSGCDKYTLLENVLERAGFFKVLEKAWKVSGKERHEFRIVIKPNISMMLRRNDVGTYTDPFLVIHLLRLLLKSGYSNLAVVESQNLYGNWFGNRSVIQVAARAGYLDESVTESYRGEKQAYIHVLGGGVDALVPMIDLSLDTVQYDFGGPIGEVELGRAWIEADFRINFAKMKTHFYSYYTLAIKNIYGCLPKQDKVRSYHCKKVVGLWTAHLINRFPVGFSIMDGYTSADGWLGMKMKAICTKTNTIIAGEDIMAVEHYGASLIDIDPMKSGLYPHLQKLTPLKPYKVVGNAAPFRYWRNTPFILVWFCTLIEAYANIMDYAGSLATGGHDRCFPVKLYEGKFFRRILYYLTLPVNIILDAGFIWLRLRELSFQNTLKKHNKKLKIVTGSEFFLARLTLFSKNEIEKLAALLEESHNEKPRYSGHFMLHESGQETLPFPLSTSNIAMAEILDYVNTNNLDKKAIVDELKSISSLCPDLFAPGAAYPYCYR